MKKLALVTLLAVSASWLLSEQPGPGGGPSGLVDALRTFRDGRRPPIQASGPSEAPLPPTPPEPPSPPEAIRTVPWRQADRARTRPSWVKGSKPPAPSWFPKSEIEEEAKARPDASGTRVLVGRLSASEDRARQDLRKTLEREVADWLAADVPPTWKVPAPDLDELVQATYVQAVTRALKPASGMPEADASAAEVPGLDDLYTLYRAGHRLDFSPARRAEIVETYRRDLATGRMQRLGGGLALALGLLAVLTGYIRADEATRGYYTNRLRLAAVAGLGAAGAAAYRLLA